MNRIASSLLMLCLLPSSALSAGQGVVVERSPEYWYSYAGKLPIGSEVTVRTVDGKRLTAVLTIVDPEGVTLEPKTRIPEPARRVRYQEMEQLALKKNGGNVARAVAIGAGVGAGTFLGLLAIIFANWD